MSQQHNIGASTEVNAEASAETNAETSAEASTEANAEASIEANAETSAEVNAETSAEVNAETSAEVNAEASAEVNAETSAEVNAETSVETSVEANIEAKTTANTDIDELLIAMQTAFHDGSSQQADIDAVNRFYTVFLRSVLYLPVESIANDQDPFQPLFLREGNDYFVPIFASEEKLNNWLGDAQGEVRYELMLGHDVIDRLGLGVHLCFNVGDNKYYKQFPPQEIERLKKVVAKTKPPLEERGQDSA